MLVLTEDTDSASKKFRQRLTYDVPADDTKSYNRTKVALNTRALAHFCSFDNRDSSQI